MLPDPTRSKLRFGILALTMSTSALSGAILVMENFDALAAGELNGQNGTAGISGSWNANEGITEVVSAPTDFSVTLAGGEVISADGNSLQLTGNSNSAISANLTTVQTDKFYVSFLVQLQAGTIDVNDFATIWFGEGTFVGAPAVGIKTELGASNTDFMGRISGSQEAYSSQQLTVGESYYLVAEVSKTGESSTYNRVDFWVNPSSTGVVPPEATSTGTIAFDEFSTFGIRSVNLDADDIVLFDNITISNDWSDVVDPSNSVMAVPEPSPPLLVGIATIVTALRRKRPS